MVKHSILVASVLSLFFAVLSISFAFQEKQDEIKMDVKKNEQWLEDVSNSDDDYDAIKWALELGIIKVDKSKTFNREQVVTEKEFLKGLTAFFQFEEREEEKIYQRFAQYKTPLLHYKEKGKRNDEMTKGKAAILLLYFSGEYYSKEQVAVEHLMKLNVFDEQVKATDQLSKGEYVVLLYKWMKQKKQGIHPALQEKEEEKQLETNEGQVEEKVAETLQQVQKEEVKTPTPPEAPSTPAPFNNHKDESLFEIKEPTNPTPPSKGKEY